MSLTDASPYADLLRCRNRRAEYCPVQAQAVDDTMLVTTQDASFLVPRSSLLISQLHADGDHDTANFYRHLLDRMSSSGVWTIFSEKVESVFCVAEQESFRPSHSPAFETATEDQENNHRAQCIYANIKVALSLRPICTWLGPYVSDALPNCVGISCIDLRRDLAVKNSVMNLLRHRKLKGTNRKDFERTFENALRHGQHFVVRRSGTRSEVVFYACFLCKYFQNTENLVVYCEYIASADLPIRKHYATTILDHIKQFLRTRQGEGMIVTQALNRPDAQRFWGGALTCDPFASAVNTLLALWDPEFRLYRDTSDMGWFTRY